MPQPQIADHPTVASRKTAAAPGTGHPTLRQLGRLILEPGGPFTKLPRRGYQRGIDYYSAAQLPLLVGGVANRFFAVHGRYPNLYAPELLNDKIFASKFLRLFKIPETANKLLTSSFIPPEAEPLVTCAPIVWHSRTERIPRGNEIEAGVYYLKSSHGCDMFQRIHYPLSDDRADALEERFRPVLNKRYGVKNGNWWHNCFAPELMIEKAIGSEEFTTSLNYVVVGGTVVRLTAYQKLSEGYRKTNFEPDWTPYDNAAGARAEFRMPSQAAKDRMAKAAQLIGKDLGYVRVDFLLDDDDAPYLGELTFTPGNGLTVLKPEIDQRLGQMWDWSAVLDDDRLAPPKPG
ncbi:ATP-grasp fold amidoligase family protein [Sphingomonas sp. URHD0057]|uniref:ATP-grasp fold amidoligase family protein n=1 Tax=Sphingomonas sp. URHD0057 TaxID=1380389 RepID=UPI00048B0F41|nr:ATP-grasp fold amidoligase family protein [Sphingomonas sp. URHD0057]